MELRAMAPAEQARAVEVVATAMLEDPGWAIVAPQRQHREILMPILVEESLRLAFAVGGGCDVAIHDGQVVGAMIWEPPISHAAKVDFEKYVGGIARASRYVVRHPREAVRAVRNLLSIDRNKPKTPFSYVVFLGCSLQGHGVGGALMRRATDHLPQGIPVYLETHNPDNVARYTHLGWDLTRHLPSTYPGGPELFCMLRPADLAWPEKKRPVPQA